jgi:hypothetical protein
LAWDAVISASARQFIDELSPEDKVAWQRALWDFFEQLLPLESAVPLPFPYPPETYGYSTSKFWFTFRQLNSETLGIAGVMFRPDPRVG